MIEFCGIGEVHRRENILEAGAGLKQHHGAVPTRSFDDIKHGYSVN